MDRTGRDGSPGEARIGLRGMLGGVAIAAVATWLGLGAWRYHALSDESGAHWAAAARKVRELDRLCSGRAGLDDAGLARARALRREIDYERRMQSWCRDRMARPWAATPPAPMPPAADIPGRRA